MMTKSPHNSGYALIVKKTHKVVVSLEMSVEEIEGKIVVNAPWQNEPIEEATFEEAYWLSMLARASG